MARQKDVDTLLRALRKIQEFDGGYQRAWDIAEEAIKAVGYASGLEVDRATLRRLGQGKRRRSPPRALHCHTP